MDLKAERKFRVGVLDESPFETEAVVVLCVGASFEVLLTDNPQEARYVDSPQEYRSSYSRFSPASAV
jgi:hypothetical protein